MGKVECDHDDAAEMLKEEAGAAKSKVKLSTAAFGALSTTFANLASEDLWLSRGLECCSCAVRLGFFDNRLFRADDDHE